MNKIILQQIWIISSVILATVTGCNFPGRSNSTPSLDVTQAYQTVEAQLTQAASLTPKKEKITPTLKETSGVTPSATLEISATIAPSQTSPSATGVTKLCDQSSPGVPIDVTIPDDTKMIPGETFTKVWRLQNTGTCAWTKDYSIAFFSGEEMNTPASVPLQKEVPPGQTIDISVDMVAPKEPGTYYGYWKLRNASKTWFGIGPNGSDAFWVKIVVKKDDNETPDGTLTVTSTASNTTPSPGAATPAIQISGNNALIPADKINLDTNQINVGAGEDLRYRKNSEGLLFLTPIGNAHFNVHGQSTPKYDDCKSAPLSNAQLALDALNAGLYICYRTDQGLYGWLRLLNLEPQNLTLSIQILTWSNP